jgi:diguanylate cyclase (GGDEF)-like protein
MTGTNPQPNAVAHEALSTEGAAILERVLACPSLPSLPGVAIKVLELTRDPQVSISKIAELVQNDPALASKVLKTINSSYYGLTQPCPSISRAMSLLGLNTVKAIVLSFSLVDSSKKVDGAGFDFTAYWRRSVYAAAGARALAIATKRCDADEAFLGALLQDIGMLAGFAAMPDVYGRVIAMAGPDHDELIKFERQALGVDHARIGSAMAERWHFPPQIIECIAKHHDAEKASLAHEAVVRVVGLSGLGAGALTLADPRRKLGAFIQRSRDWFGLTPDQSKAQVQGIAKGAVELSRLLDLRTGAAPDTAAILSQAHVQMVDVQETIQAEAMELRRSNSELSLKTVTDGLTGAFNRAHFDEQSTSLFVSCAAEKRPLAVLFIDADKFKSVNDTHGHKAGDAVLVELARRLRDSVGKSGVVCRYGGEEFAVLLPGINLDKAARVADIIRAGLEKAPIDISSTGAKVKEIKVTMSVGVSATDAPGMSFANVEALVHAADQGVYLAKRTGRNRVKTCVDVAREPMPVEDAGSPGAATAAPQPSGGGVRSVLVVEDDALASKLMEMVLARRTDIAATFAKSGEDAMESMKVHTFDVLICDIRLPGIDGIDLVRSLRGTQARCPGVLVLTSSDPALKAKAMGAGADLFLDKSQLCSSLDACLNQIFAIKSSAA